MAERYLLDTNICIYIAKYNPPLVRERFAYLGMNRLSQNLLIHLLWNYAKKQTV